MANQLDFQKMLDSLLAGGRELARKGEDIAARNLEVGDDPQSRDNMRKGMLGGAIGAGVLSVLMGTKAGRKLGGTGLAMGGLAALGKIAYDKWQEYQTGPGASAAPPVDQLSGTEADDRARLLISAMIAAANADGHIDAAERAAIQDKLSPLGEAAAGFLMQELSSPPVPETLAARATDPQAKAEVYAVSAMICGEPNPDERAYLDRLGAALGLYAPVRSAIERELSAGA